MDLFDKVSEDIKKRNEGKGQSSLRDFEKR